MNIIVLTPDKEIFRGEINSVKVPGTLGEFQVLKNHAPIVSSLEEGKIAIVTAGGEHRYYDEETGSIKDGNEAGKVITFNVSGGFVEVLKNEISLLVTGVKSGNGK
ncbi:MAG: F0F1 ATP synthase subunit epsilon [Phaeodactylibacter sp.]|nr:F0F1 ATP synthase subunit epsilon [Phaeodactylibacter sp.]MCB9303029.1 F0F1 ATP synthase subunit epsilon [Lewinellaceae bacterium]